ncbi:FAD-dependent oxidoreductase [Microbacterium kribbense]|uniref:FAD-dependent oxidoreductase n=1 Tax=Microbacterium kribbense TaxID=433645 RepID=A0ABP7GEI2_9MICO
MAGMVIIGGGLAGATAAQTLREQGYQGEVTIIADEPHSPYQRPPLSKGFLKGDEGLDAVILHPDDWYREQNIDVRTSTAATAIDPAAHQVTLSDGSTLAYDKLLLATGSSPRKLPIPGADLPGVYMLRKLDDSEALKEQLSAGGKKLVLIGSGWIGMEVAATAKQLGNDVVVLERDPVPLAIALGDDMGNVFRRMHEQNGIDLRTQVNVTSIAGTDRATGVIADGATVPADLVLIGVGAIPNTKLAEDAGIDVERGILTDASLRTSAPDVFAAGDVANAMHPILGQRMRSEHWANALGAGPVAAKAMLGQDAVHDMIPYFYSDQFDLGMELSGYPPLMRDAQLVIRGDVAGREFIVFWVDGKKVIAGMNVNVWDVNETVQKLVASHADVDLEALANPEVPLDSLVTA